MTSQAQQESVKVLIEHMLDRMKMFADLDMSKESDCLFSEITINNTLYPVDHEEWLFFEKPNKSKYDTLDFE